MKVDVKSILVIVVVFLSSSLRAQEKNFIDQNFIEVTGKAELNIVPNEIYIGIVLKEDNKEKKTIGKLESELIPILKNLGIDVEKDLKVRDISSNLKDYFLSKDNVVLTKEFQLLVTDPQIAGKVFLELQKIGISDAEIERLDHSEIESLREQVKKNAIKAAKRKASYLAEAIDQSAGRALFIKELTGNQSFDRFSNISSNGVYFYDQPPRKSEINFEFEYIQLEYSIMGRFELN